MRKTLLAGAVLAVATVLVVLMSSAFGLDLESVALLGAALGAVVALVPDRSPAIRLAGFAAGFVVSWLGYLLRAAVLPDTNVGRAFAAGLVVLLCVGVVAASVGRIPLWSTLVGAAALAGAYEFTYAAAPPEFLTSSVSTATSVLLTVAVGFLAAALVAPGESAEAAGERAPRRKRPPRAPAEADAADSTLDDFMTEKTQ